MSAFVKLFPVVAPDQPGLRKSDVQVVDEDVGVLADQIMDVVRAFMKGRPELSHIQQVTLVQQAITFAGNFLENYDLSKAKSLKDFQRYAPKTWTDDDVITVMTANPKRGKSRDRFALYRDGMTVSEYIKAIGDGGLATADLRWDVARQFIKIEAPG